VRPIVGHPKKSTGVAAKEPNDSKKAPAEHIFRAPTTSAIPTTLPHHPFEPSIPIRATTVPSGPGWLHELKHDDFRLIIQREGERVRLLTRRGYDWSASLSDTKNLRFEPSKTPRNTRLGATGTHGTKKFANRFQSIHSESRAFFCSLLNRARNA
jgi:hypothetical protein